LLILGRNTGIQPDSDKTVSPGQKPPPVWCLQVVILLDFFACYKAGHNL